MDELDVCPDGGPARGPVDPGEVLVEIRGPVAEAARVRAWIMARSGSLDGDGVITADVADDPEVPGWSRCRMTVAPADE